MQSEVSAPSHVTVGVELEGAGQHPQECNLFHVPLPFPTQSAWSRLPFQLAVLQRTGKINEFLPEKHLRASNERWEINTCCSSHFELRKDGFKKQTLPPPLKSGVVSPKLPLSGEYRGLGVRRRD